MEKEAVIVVDYQNSFANPETGSLYVKGGEKVAPVINKVVADVKNKGGVIVSSRELHPVGHISFASSFAGKEAITEAFKNGVPPSEKNFITKSEVTGWTEENNGLTKTASFSIKELKAYLDTVGDQALWPEHCVEGSEGAEFYKEFDSTQVDVEVKKGFKPDTHPYSAFEATTIDEKESTFEVLKRLGVKIVKIVGLATDYCDIATVLDARKYGIETEFITKASAGVDPAGTIEALRLMREAGAKIIE